MATRMNMMKLLQETRGLSSVTDRRVSGRSPGLFVLELRRLNLRKQQQSKLLIRIDMCDLPDIPHPVKITHMRCGPEVGEAARLVTTAVSRAARVNNPT